LQVNGESRSLRWSKKAIVLNIYPSTLLRLVSMFEVNHGLDNRSGTNTSRVLSNMHDESRLLSLRSTQRATNTGNPS